MRWLWNDLLVRLLRLLSKTVATWPAGVDAEEIGTLPMFSGDVDLSEQSDSVPWSQWRLTIRSYFGKFNRTTAWMLQQVETSVDDPIITDNTVMTRSEKRFSAQACCVLVLTCKGKALQVVQRVPRGFGFEAWTQLYEEFEPRPPEKSQEMCRALLSPAKSDESLQMVRQQDSGLKICEEQPKTMAFAPLPPGSDRVPQSKSDVQDVWKHGSHRPGVVR